MKHIATLTILTTLVLPIDAAASPPAPEVTAAKTADTIPGLVVAVDASVPNANTVQRRVEESARGALARTSPTLGAGSRVLVHVTGEQYEYNVRVSAMRLDVLLEEGTLGCECNTAELSERVSTEVTRLAARFPKSTVEPSMTATTKPTQSVKRPILTGPPSATEPKPQSREDVIPSEKPKVPAHASTQPDSRLRPVEPVATRHQTRRMWTAGVATLIAGGVLLFAGAGLMGTGSTDLLDDLPQYKRNWRPLGFSVGGAGLAGITVGGSLMLIEEIRCRRRPSSCVQSHRYAKLTSPAKFGMGARR